jgi:FkbM family methyltransferase
MDLQYLAQSTCSNGSVIFDISGHNGNTAYEIAPYVGNLGKVITFEPHYRLYNFIQDRIANSPPPNKNIIPINRALSSQIGFANFYFGSNPDANQASSLLAPSAESAMHYGTVHSTTVETDTLDAFILRHSITPNLIKLDVEGAEEQVLRGGEYFLKKQHPPIYFEYSGCGGELSVSNNNFKTVDLLLSYGYQIFLSDIMDFGEKHIWTNRSNTQNLLVPMDYKDLIQLNHYNFIGNLIAIIDFNSSSLSSKSNLISFPEFLNAVLQAERISPRLRPQFKK